MTTNLGYWQWPSVFPSTACLGALVARFAQHCDVIDIEWRLVAQARARPRD